MIKMTITEYWNCEGIPRGEPKGQHVYRDSGYESVQAAVKELSRRFTHKLAYKGSNEVVYKENLYVQVVGFEVQS
jgi:hypothetical protein